MGALGVGMYLDMGVRDGTWRLEDKGILRFDIEIDGFERGDVSLPPGSLYFNCEAVGKELRVTSNNVVTIQQEKLPFGLWKVSTIVGTWRPQLRASDEDLNLPSLRVKSDDRSR